MLNTSPDSSRIKSSFENGAAIHFCSGRIFVISLKPFIGMMQMIYRWKDVDQALHPYVEHFSNSLRI